jgi:hypothetical protein
LDLNWVCKHPKHYKKTTILHPITSKTHKLNVIWLNYFGLCSFPCRQAPCRSCSRTWASRSSSRAHRSHSATFTTTPGGIIVESSPFGTCCSGTIAPLSPIPLPHFLNRGVACTSVQRETTPGGYSVGFAAFGTCCCYMPQTVEALPPPLVYP